MITLTIVRHGESTDNVKAIWAGWADAPLSKHGMNQAKALGESLKTHKIAHIFHSDLLRAKWTAQQIHAKQSPQPPITESKLLREQNFGKGEKQPFAAGPGQGGFYRESGRGFKFENGESLDDVRVRAEKAIAEFLEPILQANKSTPLSSAPSIFFVAHGIFNSELLGALLARRSASAPKLDWKYSGMTNTGWTRLELGYADEAGAGSTGGAVTSGAGGVEGAVKPDQSAVPASPAKTAAGGKAKLPRLAVKILTTNVTTHLEGVKRQPGGIGSTSYDESQADIRKFFGGGGE